MKITIGKKLIRGLLMIAVTFAFSSCLGESESIVSYTDYAVVDYRTDINEWVINTTNSIFKIPNIGLEVGDCIYVQYTINFNSPENLSPKDFYTATEVKYELIRQTKTILVDPSNDLIDEYNDSISMIYSLIASPFFKGRAFVGTTHPKDGYFRLELLCHPDSVENGVPTIFVKTKKSDDPSGKASSSTLESFDLNPLLSVYGRDTTYVDYYNNEYDCRYVLLNLKYQSGLKGGLPVYKSIQGNPVRFEYVK